jgi:DNA-binding NtrC family response regulator
LRVLQNGEIQKLGSERTLKTDVRVISATHKDLHRCVSEGLFREDLYYRLNAIPITVPALRERPGDISLIATFLIRRLCDKNNIREKPVDDQVLWRLKEYPWPGNVRELQNVLERMLILSAERITAEDIPRDIAGSLRTREAALQRSSLSVFRDNAERQFIVSAIKRHNGNITRAAADLGIRRTYLHRRLTALKIGKPDT